MTTVTETVSLGGEGDLPALEGGAIGRFVVVGMLGRGGMGVVLEARDPALDRTVAIKLVPDLWTGEGTEGRARFAREAQAMAQLSHPNVVTVYEVGEFDGRPFIAMEYVEGTTLRVWQRGRAWRDVISVYVDAGRGLAALHRAGLVHRDFKPDNVLLGADRRPRVSDFGLVSEITEAVAPSELEEIDARGGLTVRGRVLGTPPYMAREQWRGEPVTARTDQFAYCVALWEALFDERPFAGDSAADLRAAICADQRRPPPYGRAPRWLVQALERGLAADPAVRWPGMEQLVATLERGARRRRWPLVAVGALGLVGGGAALAMSLSGGAPDACPLPTARVEAAWGEGGKEGLEARLRTLDAANAPARLASISRLVAPYLADWERLAVDACRASAGAADALAEQRTACLEARLADMTGMLARIRTAKDGATLDRAIPALAELGTVRGCSDAKVLASFTMPPSPAARLEATELAAQTRALELDRLAGHMEGLHERGMSLLARARALDHAPTTARALHAASRVEADRNDTTSATTLLRELVTVAARAPDDAAAAYAWTNLLRLTAFDLGKPAEAITMLPAAEAAVVRAGEPIELRTLLLQQRAEVYMEVKRLPEAFAALAEARKLLTAAGADDPASPLHDRVSEVWFTTGTTWLRSKEWDKAIEAFEQALRIEREAYGPDHPLSAFKHLDIAYAHRQQQRLDKALAATAEAVRVRRARIGKSPALAWALNAHANSLRELGRAAEAAPEAEEAYTMAVETMSPDDPNLINITLGAASLYEDLGKVDRAKAMYTAAAEIGERTGARNTNVPISIFNRAELARKAHDCAGALADYERAAALFVDYRGADDFYQAFPLRGWGQCLLTLGRPRDALVPLERAATLVVPPLARDQVIGARYLLGVARTRTGAGARGKALVEQARTEAIAVSKETRAELDTLLADD